MKFATPQKLINNLLLIATVIFPFVVFTVVIFNLPNIEEQLKYSPFNVSGTWQCAEMNFSISSTIDEDNNTEVSGILIIDSTQYDIKLSVLSTRGFNRKYSFVLNASSDNNTLFDCFAIFEDGHFKLLDFKFSNNFRFDYSTLTFNKTI